MDRWDKEEKERDHKDAVLDDIDYIETRLDDLESLMKRLLGLQAQLVVEVSKLYEILNNSSVSAKV